MARRSRRSSAAIPWSNPDPPSSLPASLSRRIALGRHRNLAKRPSRRRTGDARAAVAPTAAVPRCNARNAKPAQSWTFREAAMADPLTLDRPVSLADLHLELLAASFEDRTPQDLLRW